MAIKQHMGLGILLAAIPVLILFATAFCSAAPSGQISSVAISPDGKLLAVEFKHGNSSFIYKVAVDTGVATRLTDAKSGEESSPAFSADGKQIAFDYWPGKGQRSRIIVINVDGSNLRQWPPSVANDIFPTFALNDKMIVFARSDSFGSYSPIAEPHPHGWNFYMASLDGTGVRQLTNENFYMASPPSVSPDGKCIVVVTEGVDSGRKIAIYSLEHPEQPTLTLRPDVPKAADHKNPILNYPNYMPDGKGVLFMAASDGKHGYDYDVYETELGTGSLQRFTNGNGYASNLRVSAKGQTAVFLRWRSDWRATPVKSALYLLDLESHELAPLNVTGLS